MSSLYSDLGGPGSVVAAKLAIADFGAEAKGLKVEPQPIEVSDEEIDYHIQELRKGRSTRESVTDRGVVEGDYCVVAITAEGKEESRVFMTVAGKTFKELDEAIMGMKVEEMKSLTLNFPKGFQEKDWAGQTLSCKVSLNNISAAKLPELDEADQPATPLVASGGRLFFLTATGRLVCIASEVP